jgi:hypothetical protein
MEAYDGQNGQEWFVRPNIGRLEEGLVERKELFYDALMVCIM